MIGYVIGRSFSEVGYNKDEHKQRLDHLTDVLMDELMDLCEESGILFDPNVTTDLGVGRVDVEVVVKTADEGAAHTIGMNAIADAVRKIGVNLGENDKPTIQRVEMLSV